MGVHRKGEKKGKKKGEIAVAVRVVLATVKAECQDLYTGSELNSSLKLQKGGGSRARGAAKTLVKDTAKTTGKHPAPLLQENYTLRHEPGRR